LMASLHRYNKFPTRIFHNNPSQYSINQLDVLTLG
jgi:hypothetical protein